MMRSSQGQGFTLAELLIALAILGIIATFTIPKVLSAQADSKKAAIFKEAIAALYQVAESGVMDGTLTETTDGTVSGPYFINRLNAVKICGSDSTTQGCWVTASQGDIQYDDDEMGVLMHNGMVIVGFGRFDNVGRESITLDWNGTGAPNVLGEDQMRVDICIMRGATIGCFIDSVYSRSPYPAYMLGPFADASTTLWEQVFTGD